MISHISSPCVRARVCVCVSGRQMAAQCDVWKDAWRCWQRAAGPLPTSITPPLSPFSPLFCLICLLEFLPPQLFKKKKTHHISLKFPSVLFPSFVFLLIRFFCFALKRFLFF